MFAFPWQGKIVKDEIYSCKMDNKEKYGKEYLFLFARSLHNKQNGGKDKGILDG